MSIYCLAHGQVEESNWDRVKRNEHIIFYHLSAEGEIRRETEAVNLQNGEGLLACNEEVYIEPLEIQVEFLKARDAKAWLAALVLRHAERARKIDQDLFLQTEIREGRK